MRKNKKLSEMSDEELERIANGGNEEQTTSNNVSDLSNEQLSKIANQYESKGFGGIASDAFNKVIQSAMGLPSALMALPGEAYGAGKQVLTEPKRALQNVGAGFGELGHGLLSAPGNIRDYLEKKDIVSHNAPSLRPPEWFLPKEYNYAEALGAEGEQPGDQLLRGLPTGAAMAYPAGKLFSAVEKIPLTKRLASKPLQQAERLSHERKLPGLPIDEDLIVQAKEFLPKNRKAHKFLIKAASGDYKPLFDLQSQLGKIGSTLNKSSSGLERLHGREALQLRTEIIDAIKKNLEQAGHQDISDLMTKGQKKYRQFKKLEKNVYPSLKKAVGIPAAAGLGYAGYKGAKSLISKLLD